MTVDDSNDITENEDHETPDSPLETLDGDKASDAGGEGSGGGNEAGELPPSGGGGGIDRVSIEDEMHSSYLGYAMSVIIGRALPDIRDGLKPVHRRCLFAMDQMNNQYNRPYVKCARVSGEVVGKYHPHGDQASYETIVRLAQDWNMRYPLVDGHGNFGSIDGDPPAASRYTESRMSRIASAMMADLDMDTVDFGPNYDETLTMPLVLPTRIPNLLVNGATGIAVAMATNIPPHNLREVVDACHALLDDSSLSVDDLMQYVKGPDFPTAGIINGRAGIVNAYRTGTGRILVRARAEVVEIDGGREAIVVTEVPYTVNKALLIEKIAELVKDKRLEGITELRDESDKDGYRVVIELRRGERGQIVLNNLYRHTNLESAFSVNSVALVNGEPKTVNLKEMLVAFLDHRREVVVRRTNFELRQARTRGHVLEGRTIALANIDDVVALIRASSNRQAAHESLMARGWQAGPVAALLSRADRDLVKPDDLEGDFGFRDDEDTGDGEQLYYLSDVQANAILDLQLHALTNLEQDRLLNEYREIVERIRELLEILDSDDLVSQIIREELQEVRDRFGDDRRTEIVSTQADLTAKELVQPRDVVVTVSHRGYAKVQPLSEYRTQRRGGKGVGSSAVRDDDFIEHLLITHSHDLLLCFTDQGRVFWLDTYEIPEGSRVSRGRPLVNLLELNEDERVSVIFPIKDFAEDSFLFFATERGYVKRTELRYFGRPLKRGLRAINLAEEDKLIGVAVTTGHNDIMLVQSSGLAVRFKESDVRAMGRTARGVRGTRLRQNENVLSLIVPDPDCMLLTVSANGLGKRTEFDAFRVVGRGSRGVRVAKQTEKSGQLVSALKVYDTDEIMLINENGKLIRMSVHDISVWGRNAQGVKLMTLSDESSVVQAVRIDENAINDDESQNGEASEADRAGDVTDEDLIPDQDD